MSTPRIIAGALKPLLLAATFALELPFYRARWATLDSAAGIAGYAGLFAMLALAAVAAASIRQALPRWTIAAALATSAYVFHAYARITADTLSYDAFITMANSAAFADEAWAQNARGFVAALLPAATTLLAVGLAPRWRLPVPRWAVALAPAAGTAAFAALLFVRGGEGERGQPGMFVPIAYLALAGWEHAQDHGGPRQAVALARGPAPVSGDIVLVIDESVGGQYLRINDPLGVPTPLDRPPAGIAVHNYGLAVSVTNCSAGTNMTLRHGGTRADYRRINATMPSIWAYAHAAGLRTVYIDAQRTGGALHNLMDAGERAAIDRLIQFDGVAVIDRDHAAARTLAALLSDRVPQFILVNKVGGHFPVSDKYPDAAFAYRPALPRSGQGHIVDTGSRTGFGGTAQDWLRYRNSYRNTLLWNVGGFFDTLFAGARDARGTIVYTADHGQDLHERGTPGTDTHCSRDPVPEEGVVPLAVVEIGGPASDWSGAAAANRDRASHYRIFPTLLALMGYERGGVRATYGASLAEAGDDPFTFNTLFNARLGRAPEWRRVDPRAIARAPEATALAARLPRPRG